MPRFVYMPGKEFDDTDMPPFCEAFGIRFVEDTPKDVTADKFPSPAQYDHAVKKLTGHRYFRLVNDEAGAVEVLDAPKKRGRKPKLVEDAVEVMPPADVE